MDKKLISAMAEIKAILEKNDIAGFIILNGEAGTFEVLMHIATSYSVAKFEQKPEGLGLRIRSKKASYAGDADKQRADMEATLSMLSGFGEIAGVNAMHFLETVGAVKEAMPGIEQTPLHRTDGPPQ